LLISRSTEEIFVIGFRAETGVSPVLSDWLDLARGLAAVEVLAFHSYQLMFMERLPDPDYDPAIRLAYSVLLGVERSRRRRRDGVLCP